MPGNINDWVPLKTSSEGVTSVNGQTNTAIVDYNSVDAVSSSIVAPGTYSRVTVNAQGRIVSVSSTKYAQLDVNNLIVPQYMPAHTGDVTSTAGSVSLTLTNTGVTPGSYHVVNVDAKGRVTGGVQNLELPDTGVTAGTYKSVTVDAKGRVTAATNPTTMAAFGITDGFYPQDATWDMFSTTGEATPAPGGDPVVVGGVSSVNSKIGVVVLAKGDIGLGFVDNTSDALKPISTATQTALNGKQATLVSGTNIKTINGQSIVGNGDITVSGGGSATPAYEANFLLMGA